MYGIRILCIIMFLKSEKFVDFLKDEFWGV